MCSSIVRLASPFLKSQSMLNSSALTLLDSGSSSRPFATSFSEQSSSAPVFHHGAAAVQGLHNSSYSLQSVPNALLARNPDLGGGPSSDAQHADGSLPARRLGSYLPFGPSQHTGAFISGVGESGRVATAGAGSGSVGNQGSIGGLGVSSPQMGAGGPCTIDSAGDSGSAGGHSLSADRGSLNSMCVIQVASKSSAEAAYMEKLKTDNGLHVPGGAVLTTVESIDTSGSGREAFDVKEYLKILDTSQFGRLVLYSSLIPSTHTLLSQNFDSCPVGTVCVAGSQLQGRGRGGNVWQSPKGCLMFSYTTQMTNGRMVPFLQYVVSLAVIEGVDEACKTSGIPAPDVRIKWPNDLYAKGLKIGGVLCTSTYRAKTFNIVVGVGLNVGNREPTTCLNTLIEELGGGSVVVQQELLLASIMSRFEILNEIFQEQGFSPLQEAYYKKWLHTGQNVTLEEKEERSSSISHFAVTIQGLTPNGYLLASDNEGDHYELHPDGNSFDFLKGLVRRKLHA